MFRRLLIYQRYNYCMQRNVGIRDLQAYFASPSADADDVRPQDGGESAVEICSVGK
jgi:hypothetical protein